jgi:hypothetical protein
MVVGSRIVIMKYCARSCRLFDLRDGSFEIIRENLKEIQKREMLEQKEKRKSIVLGVDYLDPFQYFSICDEFIKLFTKHVRCVKLEQFGLSLLAQSSEIPP